MVFGGTVMMSLTCTMFSWDPKCRSSLISRRIRLRARRVGGARARARGRGSALGVDEVAEDVGDLLDGHAAPRRRVVGGADDAVGAAADGSQVRVAHVDVKLVAAQRHGVVFSPERHGTRRPLTLPGTRPPRARRSRRELWAGRELRPACGKRFVGEDGWGKYELAAQ